MFARDPPNVRRMSLGGTLKRPGNYVTLKSVELAFGNENSDCV